MSNQDFSIKSYNGRAIKIDPVTRFVCLTDMASANNKQFGHWNELKGTSEYLSRFSRAIGIPIEELLFAPEGSTGTWAHPKIAIRFAQWCSIDFAIQVDRWIDELLTTGKVELTHSRPLPRQLPPVRDYIEHLQAAKEIDLLQDPILKSCLMQACYEEIGAAKSLPQSEPSLVLAAVKARSMGFKLPPGEDAKLGKWVAKNIQPAGKVQHGRYEVNTYQDDDRLAETICAFFS
jgi:KilA-N domain